MESRSVFWLRCLYGHFLPLHRVRRESMWEVVSDDKSMGILIVVYVGAFPASPDGAAGECVEGGVESGVAPLK